MVCGIRVKVCAVHVVVWYVGFGLRCALSRFWLWYLYPLVNQQLKGVSSAYEILFLRYSKSLLLYHRPFPNIFTFVIDANLQVWLVLYNQLYRWCLVSLSRSCLKDLTPIEDIILNDNWSVHLFWVLCWYIIIEILLHVLVIYLK